MPINLILVGMAALLAAAVSGQLGYGPAWLQGTRPAASGVSEPASVTVERRRPGPPTREEPLRSGDTDAIARPVPALASLSATVERPLFAPSRRPPAVVTPSVTAPSQPAAPVTAPPEFGMSLTAVVFDADVRVAYFLKKSNGEFARLEEGESLDGWTLTEVREDGVTIARGPATESLDLRQYKPAPNARTRQATSARDARRAAGRRNATRGNRRELTDGRRPQRQSDSRRRGAQGALEEESLERQVRRPRRTPRGPRQESLQRLREAMQERREEQALEADGN